jgi:hypothetical protein
MRVDNKVNQPPLTRPATTKPQVVARTTVPTVLELSS